jgi:hypothetical protein
LALAWAPLAVLAAGCSGLLNLDAPQLFDAGVTVEGSVDVGSGEEPQGDDTTPGPDGSLDAPTYETAAADVVLDRTSKDAVAEAAPDVALDQATDAPASGVLCGFSGGYCDPSSTLSSCCETADDAGMPSLACVSSQSACSGYWIECANDTDCKSTEICCHYSGSMRCEPPTQGTGGCPGGGADLTQACDPTQAGECPGGQACTLHLVNSNLASPYWGCQ